MEIWTEVKDEVPTLYGSIRDGEVVEIGQLDLWQELLTLLRYFSPGGLTGITAKSDGFTITFQRPNPVYGEGTQCLTMPVRSALGRSIQEITALVSEKTAITP